MSINGIGGSYFNNTNGIFGIKPQFGEQNFAPVSPFTKYNSIFDEVVLSKKAADAEKIEVIEKTPTYKEDKVRIIAHRGYTENAPENTIPAFIAAAENGYNTVECDVEWTKDGIPVILHDATINRTARRQNGWRFFFPKRCSKLTYEQLSQYDFGSWYSKDFKGTKIPKFTELLDCADNYDLDLYVELKETTDFDDKKAQTLLQAVRDAGLEDKVTWISFNADYLKTMAKAAPKARLGYLSKKDVSKNTIETLKSLQTGENEVFLDLKANKISESSSKIIKDAGFDFEAWTVDEQGILDDLFSYDCKGITTDKITEDDIEDYYKH